MILASGKVCFYPHKLYCFKSVIDQVEGLLKRPGVPGMCEQWREREVADDIIADVYDGSIWKDFLNYKPKDYLDAPRNLAFAINIDWFQPFMRRNDRSVGVIYLVLLNLPREQRFKWENIIVAGIITEMTKEPKSLNTFLAPIVDEFKGPVSPSMHCAPHASLIDFFQLRIIDTKNRLEIRFNPRLFTYSALSKLYK